MSLFPLGNNAWTPSRRRRRRTRAATAATPPRRATTDLSTHVDLYKRLKAPVYSLEPRKYMRFRSVNWIAPKKPRPDSGLGCFAPTRPLRVRGCHGRGDDAETVVAERGASRLRSVRPEAGRLCVQGYLAHKKHPPLRTWQQGYA